MIQTKINNALDSLNIPYFSFMPDFSSGEPEKYIVYNYYDVSSCHADNEEQDYIYQLTINIFSDIADEYLYKSVKNALKSAGFTYNGSNSVSLDSFYPNKTRKIQNYTINYS